MTSTTPGAKPASPTESCAFAVMHSRWPKLCSDRWRRNSTCLTRRHDALDRMDDQAQVRTRVACTGRDRAFRTRRGARARFNYSVRSTTHSAVKSCPIWSVHGESLRLYLRETRGFYQRDSSHKYGVVKLSVNGNNSRAVATLAVRQSSVPKQGCARRNVRADGSKRKCAARRSSTRPRYCCCVTQQRYRSRARTLLLPTGIARVAGILRAPPSGIYQILCQLLDDVAQFQRLQPAFRNTRCAPKGAKDLPG